MPLIPTLRRQRQTFLCKFKVWWHTPLIPALGRLRYVDFCQFKDSLVFRVSSRTAKDTQRTCLKKPKIKIQIKEIEVKIEIKNRGHIRIKITQRF